MSTDTGTIGRRIAEARTRAGLTAAKLAFMCDWNKSRLSNYENGIRTPGPEEILQISKALRPFIGDYVSFYLLEGKSIKDVNGEVVVPNYSKEKAISSFSEFINHCVEFGRIKLEPGLSPAKFIEEYSMFVSGGKVDSDSRKYL